MLVVDASVLAVALADDGPSGATARARLRGETLTAPELLDIEVTSVLRRHHLAGLLEADRATLAIQDLAALPLQRVPHRSLLIRCWELRANITAYDAAYVALAEALDVALLTSDQRLAQAPGPTCTIEILKTSSARRSPTSPRSQRTPGPHHRQGSPHTAQPRSAKRC